MADQDEQIRTARRNWNRYTYLRDNGHTDFMEKAERCDEFFQGEQWREEDLALLRQYRRPALTINKILATVATVAGEQIKDRTDIIFRPFSEQATDDIANALTKTWLHIAQHEDWHHKRTEVFVDGLITSRGFFDVRLEFDESARGQVAIRTLNPKDVLVDADADEYDPDTWNDVIITRWMTPEDIEVLYSKAAADRLRVRASTGGFQYGVDAILEKRDRFGTERTVQSGMHQGEDTQNTALRHIRVVERQWRKLTRREYFIDLVTGERMPVPSEWDQEQVEEYLAQHDQVVVQKELGKRIRWTVTAGDEVLHDDWSPYEHFTVIPFFPYFRRGNTVGIVENLLGVQELLNKVSSQELHIVNTSANSGWMVRAGSLQNMSTAELEEQGAKTGLVLELNDIGDAAKIQPNQVPAGLDHISGKAEEHIDTVSGVSDHMRGFAREDVSGRALSENREAGRTGVSWAFDNLTRTDRLLARTVLSLVQSYYVEERLLRIHTGTASSQRVEDVTVNEVDVDGSVLRDLTLGKYSVTISSQPDQETFRDSQFDQAVRLRTEAGIDIPDHYIIAASRLENRQEIAEELRAEPSRDQQEMDLQAQRLELEEQQAKIEGVRAKAANDHAKAMREQASLQKMQVETQNMALEGPEQNADQGMDADLLKMQAEMQLKQERQEAELAMQREKMQQELQLQRERMQLDAQVRMQQHRQQMLSQAREGLDED